MKPLQASDIRGNWASLLSVWNADGSLDPVRLKLQIERLISFKVDGIYSNGTAGEFHSQRECEFDQMSEILAEKCNDSGMPFQLGVSHMSAQISLDRLKRSVHLAPGAFQVILPDWFPVTDQEAIDFLKRMADAADGIGLVLYNPPHAKRVLNPEQVAVLSKEVPSLVGLKTAGGDEAWYSSMRAHLSHMSVFIPGHHMASGLAMGAQGSYSNVACLNPQAAQKWFGQMQTDPDVALELEGRILKFMTEHILPFITEQKYCNAACDRLLALIGGWAPTGEYMRWPYRSIPSSEADRLRVFAKEILPEFF